MNLRRIMFVGFAAVFVVGEMMGRFSARSEAQVAPAAAPDRSVAQIAHDRLATADAGLKMAEQKRRMGLGNAIDETRWVRRRALAAADLPDRAERISVLEDCVRQMKPRTAEIEQLSRTGTADVTDVQSAKFDALEVELLLAKAR